MSKTKYLSGKKLQQALFSRTEGYAANVRAIYQNKLTEIIDLVKGTELEEGKPFSFSEYGYTEEVQPILRSMYSQVYQVIQGGAKKEWLLSEENNDELVKSIFGSSSIEDHHFARYFLRNKEAMDAFLSRKIGGMDLSKNVWNLTGRFKEELEDSLDLAIGEGTAANALASKIKKYLNDPDRFYRRFRVKIGEDENGNPLYGRIWKRRIWSAADNSYKWIDADPGKYHPGKGVYRSSARNAQRLARTETNMAYRSADYERWQNFEFVVGVEIKLSNNHPTLDICDDLKGVYPKFFKWTGWHANCRCYMVPVLAPKESLDNMLEKILAGEDPGTVEIPNQVKETPQNLKDWIKTNEDRYEKAKANGKLPYWIKDNQKAVEKALKGLSPEEQKALSYSDLLVNPLEILEKHGAEALDQLYSAVQSKLSGILKGDLSSQKSTLEFEINWVKDKKKYATWREAADAYQKALDNVNLQIQKREVENMCKGVDQFLADHPKSKVVKALKKQIQDALSVDDLGTAKELLANADEKILKYNLEQAKKAANKISMVSDDELEKYCDAHRSWDELINATTDNKTFNRFQDRMVADSMNGWSAGSVEAKSAIRGYTNGTYDDINESYWRYHKGCDDGKLMGEIIDKCVLSEDTVLRRGCGYSEMQSIFGDAFKDLMDRMDIDGLNKMAGARGINEGFISTSFDMSGGFWKSVDLRIYAPKGTQAIYAKPISGFGDGLGKDWTGTNHSHNFVPGRENEVIVNRGYEYRFVKAEAGGAKGSRITIYIELLSRNKRTVL